MRLYLAAPFVDHALMDERCLIFEDEGHTITHKWWHTEHEDKRPLEERSDYLREHAFLDFKGVMDCEALVVFHTAKSEGKATEQGIALAMGIPIFAIGERGYKVAANIFHWLPDYIWCDNINDAIIELGRM
jgi:hypothetical protein